MSRKMTARMRRFVQLYDGSGLEAARAAGYKGKDRTLAAVASENLAKPDIQAAILSRETTELRPGIVARHERQLFWSAMMMNEELDTTSRLRASELLGKSEGDFLNKVEVANNYDDLAERIRRGRERAK